MWNNVSNSWLGVWFLFRINYSLIKKLGEWRYAKKYKYSYLMAGKMERVKK